MMPYKPSAVSATDLPNLDPKTAACHNTRRFLLDILSNAWILAARIRFKYVLFAAIALIINRFEGWVPALSFLCLALLLGNLSHLNNLNRLTRWLTRTTAT